MLRISDIMTKEVITLSTDTDISQAAQILLDRKINGAPVVNHDGKLVGILCQSDLIIQQKALTLPTVFTVLDGFIPIGSMKHLEREIEKIAATKVSQAMTKDPVTVNKNTTIEDAAMLMVEKKFHTLPVVDEDGNLIGIVGKQDILKTLVKK